VAVGEEPRRACAPAPDFRAGTTSAEILLWNPLRDRLRAIRTSCHVAWMNGVLRSGRAAALARRLRHGFRATGAGSTRRHGTAAHLPALRRQIVLRRPSTRARCFLVRRPPPLLAISRCFSGDIDAKPRRSLRSFIMSALLCVPVLTSRGALAKAPAQDVSTIGSGRAIAGSRAVAATRMKLQSPCHHPSRHRPCLLGIHAICARGAGRLKLALQWFATEGLVSSSECIRDVLAAQVR